MTIEETVDQLKASSNKKECLKLAYDILSKKYHGERLKTIIYFPQLFIRNTDKLWTRQGFMHCTNINRILTHLLIESGFFKDFEIQTKWTIVNCCPHQYLKIKVADNQTIDVDIWAKNLGVSFGKHARGFL